MADAPVLGLGGDGVVGYAFQPMLMREGGRQLIDVAAAARLGAVAIEDSAVDAECFSSGFTSK